MSNIFERAVRQKLRFPSSIGELTVEQLYDLNISDGRFNTDLNSVYSMLLVRKRNMTDDNLETLSESTANPRLTEVNLKLEIVKHIADYKNDLVKASIKRAEKAATRTKLREALMAKKDEAITGASEEELNKMLEDLDKE